MGLVISDSSTLIHLAAISRLGLLKKFYRRITIPHPNSTRLLRSSILGFTPFNRSCFCLTGVKKADVDDSPSINYENYQRYPPLLY